MAWLTPFGLRFEKGLGAASAGKLSINQPGFFCDTNVTRRQPTLTWRVWTTAISSRQTHKYGCKIGQVKVIHKGGDNVKFAACLRPTLRERLSRYSGSATHMGDAYFSTDLINAWNIRTRSSTGKPDFFQECIAHIGVYLSS